MRNGDVVFLLYEQLTHDTTPNHGALIGVYATQDKAKSAKLSLLKSAEQQGRQWDVDYLIDREQVR